MINTIAVQTGTMPQLVARVRELIDAYNYGAIERVGPTGGAVTVDWSDSNQQLWYINAPVTFTFTNMLDGKRYILTTLQTGAGNFSYTFPANVLWTGGFEPTTGAASGRYDLFTFQYLATENVFIGAYNLNYS